jgi:REP element-mobilizing transposase RayT
MARKLPVEYEGAIYHVMNRGDRRELIFLDGPDREVFLATLGEACTKTGWQVHALCLMPNHFHLVVETPEPNLVAGMKWLLGTYTSRFNRQHKCFGHLFSGRYKALIVDGSGNGYLKTVYDYVHLNPARAKLLTLEQPLPAQAGADAIDVASDGCFELVPIRVNSCNSCRKPQCSGCPFVANHFRSWLETAEIRRDFTDLPG